MFVAGTESREERRLIRQRGAGARELKSATFGFTFGFAAPIVPSQTLSRNQSPKKHSPHSAPLGVPEEPALPTENGDPEAEHPIAQTRLERGRSATVAPARRAKGVPKGVGPDDEALREGGSNGRRKARERPPRKSQKDLTQPESTVQDSMSILAVESMSNVVNVTAARRRGRRPKQSQVLEIEQIVVKSHPEDKLLSEETNKQTQARGTIALGRTTRRERTVKHDDTVRPPSTIATAQNVDSANLQEVGESASLSSTMVTAKTKRGRPRKRGLEVTLMADSSRQYEDSIPTVQSHNTVVLESMMEISKPKRGRRPQRMQTAETALVVITTAQPSECRRKVRKAVTESKEVEDGGNENIPQNYINMLGVEYDNTTHRQTMKSGSQTLPINKATLTNDTIPIEQRRRGRPRKIDVVNEEVKGPEHSRSSYEDVMLPFPLATETLHFERSKEPGPTLGALSHPILPIANHDRIVQSTIVPTESIEDTAENVKSHEARPRGATVRHKVLQQGQSNIRNIEYDIAEIDLKASLKEYNASKHFDDKEEIIRPRNPRQPIRKEEMVRQRRRHKNIVVEDLEDTRAEAEEDDKLVATARRVDLLENGNEAAGELRPQGKARPPRTRQHLAPAPTLEPAPALVEALPSQIRNKHSNTAELQQRNSPETKTKPTPQRKRKFNPSRHASDIVNQFPTASAVITESSNPAPSQPQIPLQPRSANVPSPPKKLQLQKSRQERPFPMFLSRRQGRKAVGGGLDGWQKEDWFEPSVPVGLLRREGWGKG